MYCKYCGKMIPDDSLFCQSCGRKTGEYTEDKQKKPRHLPNWLIGMLIIMVIVGAFILLLRSGILSQQERRYEGPGYASSEDAAVGYATALSHWDFYEACSACAIETAALNFDVIKETNETGHYSPIWKGDLVYYIDNECGEELLIERYRKNVWDRLYRYYTFVRGFDPEKIYGGYVRIGDTVMTSNYDVFKYEDVEGFLTDIYGSVKPTQNISISVKEIPDYSPSDEKLKKQLDLAEEKAAELYKNSWGADESSIEFVGFEIDGEEYIMVLDTVCYNGKWYVFPFKSVFRGLTSQENTDLYKEPEDKKEPEVNTEPVETDEEQKAKEEESKEEESELPAKDLLDAFVRGDIDAEGAYEGQEKFNISDLLNNDEEWLRYTVGERLDLDNDGEDELIMDGPYGGMYLDARDGKVVILARGEGTAGVLNYAQFDDAVWVAHCDTSHGGRECYFFDKYNGKGEITDSTELSAEYWDSPDDKYDENSDFKFKGEKITMEEFEGLRGELFYHGIDE